MLLAGFRIYPRQDDPTGPGARSQGFGSQLAHDSHTICSMAER